MKNSQPKTSKAIQPSRRLLCVRFPLWPIQRIAHAFGESQSPLVVTVPHGNGNRVAVACDRAQQAGISIGMTLAEAESLLGSTLRVSPYKPYEDRRELVRLASECQKFSPAVAVESADNPEALLIELNGLWPLWGKTPQHGETLLTEAVAQHFRQIGWRTICVVGPTVGLCLAVAAYGDCVGIWQASKSIVSYQISNASEVAYRLPVESLRLSRVALQQLDSLGIETIGQLLALSRSGLGSRFGDELLLRVDQLLGRIAEPLESHRALSPLVASFDYENAVGVPAVLEQTVQTLLEKLCESMQKQHCGALRLIILYREESAVETPLMLNLFQPVVCPKELGELARLHADRLHLQNRVASISIRIIETGQLGKRQRQLFDDASQSSSHDLAVLVNRLASRLGDDHVTRLKRRRSLLPERTYELCPATQTPNGNYKLSSQEAEHYRRRPLLTQPNDSPSATVKVNHNGLPTLLNGQTIQQAWGPERIETNWWRGPNVRRDYYWIELATGGRLWLCHDLRSNIWRLAGEFA